LICAACIASGCLAQVLGPLSDDFAAMFGNYAPNVQAIYSTSPLDGLRDLADIVDVVPGCSDVLCSQYDSAAVGIAAALADAVVVCLGSGMLHFFLTTISSAAGLVILITNLHTLKLGFVQLPFWQILIVVVVVVMVSHSGSAYIVGANALKR